MIFWGENYHLEEKQTDLSYMTITITLSNRSSVSNFILSPITNKNHERNRALKKRKKGKMVNPMYAFTLHTVLVLYLEPVNLP